MDTKNKMISPHEIKAYLQQHTPLHIISDGENQFFMRNAQSQFPIATLVFNDAYDTVSQLSNRTEIYRLNLALSRERFLALIGTPVKLAPGETTISGFDYTQLHTFLPHPHYGMMFWACILNPLRVQWPLLQNLLQEAHAAAV